MSRLVTLGEVLRHRKGFILIDDAVDYKRCRVQLHRRGVEVRDIVPGTVIRTKKQQLCKAGDFIVAEMDAKFGGYGFLNDALEGAIVSSHYYLFEVITEKMLPGYLAVINKTDILQNQIKAKGSTNYSAVRPVDVLGWTIPLPSLAEQQRIIDEVEVTEKEQQLLLPEFDQQLAHLTQLRQALLREAMQGQLLPQDHTDEPAAVLLQQLPAAAKPGKGGRGKAAPLFAKEAEVVEGPFAIPASWGWYRLGERATFYNGDRSTNYPSGSDIKSEGIPFIYTPNIKNGLIDLDPSQLCFITKEKFLSLSGGKLEDGDLVMVLRGATLGKVALFKRSPLFETGFINAQLVIIRTDGLVASDFLTLLLKSEFFQSQVINKSSGSAQPQISAANLKTAFIPLPPLTEQHRIVAKLAQLLQHCDALEQRIRESRRLAEQLLATALREALAPPTGTALAAAPEVPFTPEPATLRRRGRPLATKADFMDLFNQPL